MDLYTVGDETFKRLRDNLPVGINLTIASGTISNMSTTEPTIVMTHNPGPRYPTTIGDCKRRTREGIIYFQVRYPAINGGDTQCMILSEKIAKLFEHVYNGNWLRYGDTECRNLGRDGAWYMYNVVINYSFEEVY